MKLILRKNNNLFELVRIEGAEEIILFVDSEISQVVNYYHVSGLDSFPVERIGL